MERYYIILYIKYYIMNNYHIFIASCIEGLDIQVPRIIKNILESNIPIEYIHIIVGGCSSNKVYYNEGIEIVHVMYRSFEFTSHIYIAKNPDKYDFDFGFLTHDTVYFGKNFYNLMKEHIAFLRTTSYDTMKIDIEWPSMNIGIYSKKIIINNIDILNEITINTNDRDELFKLKCKLIQYEDFILNQNSYTNHTNISEKIKKEFEEVNGSISHGFLRIFKYIDFIKYQRNAHIIQSIDICKID